MRDHGEAADCQVAHLGLVQGLTDAGYGRWIHRRYNYAVVTRFPSADPWTFEGVRQAHLLEAARLPPEAVGEWLRRAASLQAVPEGALETMRRIAADPTEPEDLRAAARRVLDEAVAASARRAG